MKGFERWVAIVATVVGLVGMGGIGGLYFQAGRQVERIDRLVSTNEALEERVSELSAQVALALAKACQLSGTPLEDCL